MRYVQNGWSILKFFNWYFEHFTIEKKERAQSIIGYNYVRVTLYLVMSHPVYVVVCIFINPWSHAWVWDAVLLRWNTSIRWNTNSYHLVKPIFWTINFDDFFLTHLSLTIAVPLSPSPTHHLRTPRKRQLCCHITLINYSRWQL